MKRTLNGAKRQVNLMRLFFSFFPYISFSIIDAYKKYFDFSFAGWFLIWFCGWRLLYRVHLTLQRLDFGLLWSIEATIPGKWHHQFERLLDSRHEMELWIGWSRFLKVLPSYIWTTKNVYFCEHVLRILCIFPPIIFLAIMVFCHYSSAMFT